MSHKVQLSGNEMLNRKVLSSRRKVRSDETVRRETGRVFHARAAATGNARSPRLDRLVAGTNKVDVEPELINDANFVIYPRSTYLHKNVFLNLMPFTLSHYIGGST